MFRCLLGMEQFTFVRLINFLEGTIINFLESSINKHLRKTLLEYSTLGQTGFPKCMFNIFSISCSPLLHSSLYFENKKYRLILSKEKSLETFSL